MRIMGETLRPPVLASVGEHGYRTVSVDGQRKGVHQLVCLAWHGIAVEGASVDHIDGNRSNNRVDNLRWASKREQVLNRTAWKNRTPSNTLETQEDLPGELWKKDNERLAVSNMGRVQRINAKSSGKRFTPHPSAHQKYAIVQSSKYVHRLVFLHFVGGLLENQTVDHINGDRTDNRASNLRAASKSEQTLNRVLKPITKRSQTIKSRIEGRPLNSTTWTSFESCHDAVRQLNKLGNARFDAGRVSAVSRGGRGARSTNGWTFRIQT